MARNTPAWYHQVMTKFSKDMAWAEPYVREAARRKLFSPMKIVEVRGYRLRLDLEEHQDAGITKTNGKYRIYIRTWSRKQVSKRPSRWAQKRIYLYDALDALAHELAHSVEWEHTPHHTRVQMGIMSAFVDVAEKLGVKDMWSRIPRA